MVDYLIGFLEGERSGDVEDVGRVVGGNEREGSSYVSDAASPDHNRSGCMNFNELSTTGATDACRRTIPIVLTARGFPQLARFGQGEIEKAACAGGQDGDKQKEHETRHD